MAHKKEYTVNGDKVSDYNKDYYKKNKTKLLKRSNRFRKNNPNYSSNWYKNNIEHATQYRKDYYKEHREEILKQKEESKKKKKVSIVLM